MKYPTASDYTAGQVRACESVVLELHRILGEYWEHVAIVGGWVPTLLANNAQEPHKGTVDVDLALNNLLIPEEAYEKIHGLLMNHGYVHNTDKAKQFQYFRTIKINGTDYTVALDLLTGEYDVESGKSRRHEAIQDANALKVRGVDLVFSHFEKVTIEGELPDKGGKDKAECKVASATPIIVMKCTVLAKRFKDKDSYDLYYFINNYGGGVDAVFHAINPDLNHGLMKEAIERLRIYYSEPEASGPAQVARFLEVIEDEDRDVVMRDVFETIQSLLALIDKHLDGIAKQPTEGETQPSRAQRLTNSNAIILRAVHHRTDLHRDARRRVLDLDTQWRQKMQTLINRQRVDNDRSFKVLITGFSRGNWRLLMQILHDVQRQVFLTSQCAGVTYFGFIVN